MNNAANAVLALNPKAFPSAKGNTAVSGPIRRAVLLHLAEAANYACITEKCRLRTYQKGDTCKHEPKCEWTCFVGVVALAQQTGWSESTVERALLKLDDDGWIHTRTLGKGRVYRLDRAKLHSARDPKTKRRDTTGVAATGDGAGTGVAATGDGAGTGVAATGDGAGTPVAPTKTPVEYDLLYKKDRKEDRKEDRAGKLVRVLAEEIQRKMKLSGEASLDAIARQCVLERDDGVHSDETIRDQMVGAYEAYEEAKSAGSLKFSWGPESFFNGGHWRNSDAWPWKEGRSPASGHGLPQKPLSAMERMRMSA